MTTLTPPPPGFPVRDANVGLIWHQNADGEWSAPTPAGGSWLSTWDDLAGGKYGPLELLVPVPYTPDSPEPGTDDARRALLEGVLSPVADMARQLMEAAGAGLLAVMADIAQQIREEDREEIHAFGHDEPVHTLTVPRPRPRPEAEHGTAGEPYHDPDAWENRGGWVARCRCGQKFVDRTPDKAAEFRAEHIAAVDHQDATRE